jgi:small subunit ribosomal protein S17
MERKTNKKEKKGVVISTKMDKTAIVKVYRTVQHPFYKKTIKKATKFKVHDENNQAQVGDLVLIAETRPISKEKRWRIVKKIEIKVTGENND